MEVFPDGRLFLRCAAFLISVLIVAESIIHSRAKEGGPINGKMSLTKVGHKDCGTKSTAHTAPE